MSQALPRNPGRDAILALLLVGFLTLNCISMTAVLRSSVPGHLQLWPALATTFALALFIPLFMWARFGFGYVVAFSFYCMIASYVWLSYFVAGSYDHTLARWSVIASLLLLLVPLLFQVRPLRPRFILSPRMMNRLLLAVLAFTVVVLAWNARYGFALVSTAEADRMRSSLLRPAVLSYIDGWLAGALLPFGFAWFITRHRYGLAAITIVLIVA